MLPESDPPIPNQCITKSTIKVTNYTVSQNHNYFYFQFSYLIME